MCPVPFYRWGVVSSVPDFTGFPKTRKIAVEQTET